MVTIQSLAKVIFAAKFSPEELGGNLNARWESHHVERTAAMRQAKAVIDSIRSPIDQWLEHQIEHGYAPDGLPVEMNVQYADGRRSAFTATKAMIDAALGE